MSRRLIGLLCCVLLVIVTTSHADIVVTGKTEVQNFAIVDLTASFKGAGKSTQYRWKVVSGVPTSIIRLGEGRILLSGPPGTYKLSVLVVDFDVKVFDEADVTVTIGVPTPGPDPGPKPPDPPTPVPVGALTVLIVFESQELPKLPSSQRDGIIRSLKFQNVLTDRTDKNGPNKRGWNIWDKDQQGIEKMDQFWQDAFKRSRPTLPYIHLFKGGKVVHECELPKTAEEATNLINKYS